MWKFVAVAAALASPVLADTRLDTYVGGRTLKDATGWQYQWPAVYFESRFTGDAVTLKFDDPSNNLNVVVDGRIVAIVKKPGRTEYRLDRLGAGEHTIRLEKRSETQYATGRFEGFFVPEKTAALAAPAYPRQIEFIGDSLTVGYGNTSPYNDCTPEEVFETTDAQQGFGPLVAKHFKAAYRINAFSGLGMVRNYGGFEHSKYRMPMLYPRAIFDDPTSASRDGWKPQIIITGIGGNDFSTPVKPGEPWTNQAELKADYVKTYTAFVTRLRADNPEAFLIVAVEDGRGDYTAGTREVYEAIRASGDTRIGYATIPPSKEGSCYHPNTRDDAAIAKMYIDYISARPELWQGK
jgi:lysophospholipase L1-like esterase